MTESGTRIVIRHLSGSKVNQIDQFDLAGLQEITLGRDFGTTIEVPTGLAPGEEVILNPPASLETGMIVRTRKDDKVPLHGAIS